MPTYNYECKKCKHSFTIVHKMTDPDLEECPHCREDELKKVMQPSNFILKGTGWYKTDFKDN